LTEFVEFLPTVVRVGVSVVLLGVLFRAYRRTGSAGFLIMAAAVSVAPWASEFIISPVAADLALRIDPRATRSDQAFAGTVVAFPIDLLLVTWAVLRFSRDIDRRRQR